MQEEARRRTYREVRETCPVTHGIMEDTAEELVKNLPGHITSLIESELSEHIETYVKERLAEAAESVQDQTNIPMRTAWIETMDDLMSMTDDYNEIKEKYDTLESDFADLESKLKEAEQEKEELQYSVDARDEQIEQLKEELRQVRTYFGVAA